ncbi:MAG: ImmA/IrrE family metallo-endopeptidase [Lachnospiraceae bacterium]|nr:ImmA/IrrE family metallo-endopeptidase [Lachnospiraceae bacterium]
MNTFYTRTEIDEIGAGLIQVYKDKHSSKVVTYIDIEHFITDFLGLKIEFASFAEDDYGKIGFTSDGETELMINQNGRVLPFSFPKNTIVIEKFLLSEKEYGRRRFTMAHEAAHHILAKLQAEPAKACFHNEYDNERAYTKEELSQIFSSNEWQADAMAASLLMPRFLVEGALVKYAGTDSIKLYGESTLSAKDKAAIKKMARALGVSISALRIRLEHLNMIEKLDMKEFIHAKLFKGGEFI